MGNDYRPRVLEFVRRWGPVLPVQVSKELNTNILFAGAMLSELVSRNQVIVTSTKKGGSPFYYIKGQEAKLQNLSSNLSGKEKEAYEVLKEKKIIKDRGAMPWLRVALRAISDFAVQLNVTIEGKEEIFWKWYLLDENTTKEKIASMLELVEISDEPYKQEEQVAEEKQGAVLSPQVLASANNLVSSASEQEVVQLAQDTKVKKKRAIRQKGRDVELLALEYFNERAIRILEKETIRKSKDARFILEVPSGVGNILYYARAKSKVSVTEDDLTSVFGEAKQRNLPAILLIDGELSKKAKEALEVSFKSQLLVFRL